MKLNSWQVDFEDLDSIDKLEYAGTPDIFINNEGIPVVIYTPMHIFIPEDMDVEMQYMYLTEEGNWKTDEDMLPTDIRVLLIDPDCALTSWELTCTATEKTILMLMGKL